VDHGGSTLEIGDAVAHNGCAAGRDAESIIHAGILSAAASREVIRDRFLPAVQDTDAEPSAGKEARQGPCPMVDADQDEWRIQRHGSERAHGHALNLGLGTDRDHRDA